MKKWFYVFVVIVGLGIMGCGHWPWEPDNVLVNPGFDESPWDTGWTIEIDTSSGGDGTYAIAEARSDTGNSLPNCCFLKANADENCWPRVTISQTFDPIKSDCEIKAKIKYRTSSAGEGTSTREIVMQVYANNEWMTIWQVRLSDFDSDTSVTVWTEISTTKPKTLTGISSIRFVVEASAWAPEGSGKAGGAELWIDDVFIGAK